MNCVDVGQEEDGENEGKAQVCGHHPLGFRGYRLSSLQKTGEKVCHIFTAMTNA